MRHQDRQGRMGQDVAGGTAENHLPHPALGIGPLDQQIGSRSADQLPKVYREGILVNVLNPKVALFFLAFLPQFIDTNSRPAALQIIVLGLVMSLMGMASNIVYALTGGALRNLLERRPRFLQAQRYATGTVYLGLGAAAALAGGTRR